MFIICSDLEGVFVPEIWINVAEKTGIEELRLTTRDEPDYDVLMRKRLAILKREKLKLADITAVIETMEPLEGAAEFLQWLRSHLQLIVVSDTYAEFAGPLMKKLGWPTLFCHDLSVSEDGSVVGYNLRQADSKKKAVEALKGLNFRTLAMGDSYNDISMLQAAETGILFRPPENVVAEFPEFPVTRTYAELRQAVCSAVGLAGE